MIAYEIQLRYVIRDKIQSETNSVRDKIWSETKPKNFLPSKFFFVRKKFLKEKKSRILSWTEFCLGFPVRFF